MNYTSPSLPRPGLLGLLLLGLTSSALPGEAAGPALIPWPSSVRTQPGQFLLNAETAVVADPAFSNEAAWAASQLRLRSSASAGTNRVLLTRQDAVGLAPEAYRLEVGPGGITIRASSSAGAFYGCQTLRELLEPQSGSVPFIAIEDAPRFAWRGLMLDVSRHFFDKPTLLRLLDWMSDYKLNRFHLHLTDDAGWRVEIQKYPALTRTGAQGNHTDTNAPPRFFTRAEIHEIVAYAQARHIVVVPEIDMPGHAGAAIRAFPQLDGGGQTLNPARETTYGFLQDVLLEVMEMFPSPWLHLGGDEVNANCWKSDPDVTARLRAEGLEQPRQLEQAFVRRMALFISQQGRTPAGWDEVAAAKTGSNTVVFWWRHDKPEVLAQALAGGYSVVLAPRAPCYFDYPQDESYPVTGRKLYNTPAAVYRGPEIPSSIPPAQRAQILGVEACVWTERIETVSYLQFKVLPRLAAFSEMAWTPDIRRDFSGFDRRLKPFLERYRREGIHFYDATQPENSRRAALFSTESASR